MTSAHRHGQFSRVLSGGEEMRQWLRVVLSGASVWALMALLPYAISPAHAQNEIHLNSSTVQVVHNTPGTDVLNLSLNVTSDGDSGCDGEDDDLLESGVHVAVAEGTCDGFFLTCTTFPFVCPALPFNFFVNPYVEH